jgi:DNA-directed RNA polymerase beta' subunit
MPRMTWKQKDINLLKEDIINVNKRLLELQVKVKRILIKNHDHMLAGHLSIAKK